MTVEPKNFLSVTLFPCAICNLNCSYCGIDKNKALYEVDKILSDIQEAGAEILNMQCVGIGQSIKYIIRYK